VSGPLAIAAVTASLKDLLNDGLLDHDLSSIGSVSVTALPPDRISTGQTEPNQLNLFLYQVTPNLGWRNADLPSRDSSGARVSNPPLALDLHYMLTAYGSQDLNAEVLLGYAMQLLHETPMLTRAQLRTVLASPSPVDGSIVPGIFGALSALDLADQVELIKITPAYLGAEELTKLWTAMQARFRPTMGYLVSVVLIQARQPRRIGKPVLKRGPDDRGPIALAGPIPTINTLRPALSELMPAVRLGEDILIGGASLSAGTVTARFTYAQLQILQNLPIAASSAPDQIRVHLPGVVDNTAVMNTWAVGFYTVRLDLVLPNGEAWPTNELAIALSPTITVTPLGASPGTVNLTVSCTPRLRSDQERSVTLIFGSTEVTPGTITNPADITQPTTLTFSIPSVVAGSYPVRLRVDGIDSLPVRYGGTPPAFNFDTNQVVVIT
jgi:hypothetical protein